MSRTTPPRPLDVLEDVPGLADHARATTRLHPRRGAPTIHESSIGGPLLWPADEPWPTCAAPPQRMLREPLPTELAERLEEAQRSREGIRPSQEELALHQEVMATRPGAGLSCTNGIWEFRWYEAVAHPEPNPLVAVAQLHAADVPTIAFPDGKDLLQVLWCPLDHHDEAAHYWGPAVTVVWRRADEVGVVLAEPPAPLESGGDGFLPHPCRLHPEQVVEYQYSLLLPDPLRDRLDAADDEWDGYGLSYQYDLSIAPGCKAGGWASWHLTDPWNRVCADCGAGLDLLVQFDTSEWDGIKTWIPVEEDWDDREAQLPTGLVHGRWGALRLFTCSADPAHRIETNIQ